MIDILSTARRIVEQINCGDTTAAAEALDRVFHTRSRHEFQKVVEAIERIKRADADQQSDSRGEACLSHPSATQHVLKINNWSVYPFRQPELFSAAGD